jgi:hypothetical protein
VKPSTPGSGRSIVAAILSLVFGAVTYARLGKSVGTGTVTDPSGAVVQEAKVTTVNEGTSLEGTPPTNRVGICDFATAITLPGFAADTSWPASSLRAGLQQSTSMDHDAHVKRAADVPLSFEQLRATVEKLLQARTATAKYLDICKAEADGYRPVGPYVPGMGIHYVRSDLTERPFDPEQPPILLYGKDSHRQRGYSLLGVSYVLNTLGGPDGQPVDSPFPKALAQWHKHQHVCVLPDNDATVDLSEEQCKAQKGEFIPETPWMVHAWIWQDSPAGVFSFTNPTLQ